MRRGYTASNEQLTSFHHLSYFYILHNKKKHKPSLISPTNNQQSKRGVRTRGKVSQNVSQGTEIHGRKA